MFFIHFYTSAASNFPKMFVSITLERTEERKRSRLVIWHKEVNQIHNQGKRSLLCKFEDYLKIDFYDWMTFRILLRYKPSVLFKYHFCWEEHSGLE